MKFLNREISTAHFVLALILFSVFLLRLPSLFEPFWYGDEGIFAAVARNLNLGGILYQTAWDNKPPMIYLTYGAIFKYLGVSMFSLRLVTSVVVLATAAVIFELAQSVMGSKRALVATLIFGLLSSARIIEGNLALTEIFMLLPICLAMMIAVKRKFDAVSLVSAGFLFAVASLYKQVGAFEAAALGIYLFLVSKNWIEFIKRGFLLTLGFTVPYLLTVFYFVQKNLLGEYIFAAYTYYNIYLGESPKYARLITILKFTPVICAVLYGVWKVYGFKLISLLKMKKGGSGPELTYLFILWAAFSFMGSYFSGRAYGHYLVQAVPALSLLLATISIKFQFRKSSVLFGVVFFGSIIFLTRLLFADFFSIRWLNQIDYYKNFSEFASGKKNLNTYNDYFDGNVNSIMALSDFFSMNKVEKQSAYIWGDVSWLYAMSDLHNPSRYVTSFHVFGVPGGKEEVGRDLSETPPNFIIKRKSNIGYFPELENVIAGRYTLVLVIEDSEVYMRTR